MLHMTTKNTPPPEPQISSPAGPVRPVRCKNYLSPARVKAFLPRFHRLWRLPFYMFLRLLGLMATSIHVVPLGSLLMRELQWWVNVLQSVTDSVLSKCQIAVSPP